MADEPVRHGPPDDIARLLARIGDSWRGLHETLDGIPDDRLEEPGACGAWSVKDLFGHLALWDDNAVAQIPRVLAGHGRAGNDVQAMNDADYAEHRDDPLPKQRAAMERAHAALVEQLETIAGADATALDAALRDDTYEHYDEHRREIAAWRAREGI
jgi:uncharacterized protein (TIGR03083 family)